MNDIVRKVLYASLHKQEALALTLDGIIATRNAWNKVNINSGFQNSKPHIEALNAFNEYIAFLEKYLVVR